MRGSLRPRVAWSGRHQRSILGRVTTQRGGLAMTNVASHKTLLVAPITVAVALVTLLVGFYMGTAKASAGSQAKEYVLRHGDEIYLPGLDLWCFYGAHTSPAASGLQLDCGRRSTDMEGLRIIMSRRF